MFQILGAVWALLLGMTLIMIGNGMQATLMGVRGGIEGFSTLDLAVITSGYFVGFLAGSRLAPHMIRQVGHVRVFAALGSFMSAALIAFPLLSDPWVWSILRVAIGFCMSGIYVTSESWLNNAATNATRGKVLGIYMIAQTLGGLAGQGMLNLASPDDFTLFVLASIVVSLAFAPILLSAKPVPAAEKIRPMSLRRLYDVSPLGTVGLFLLGIVFSAQAGMGAVYGQAAGLGVGQIATFVSALIAGALITHLPIGWLSDRMDRRRLIMGASVLGALACILGGLSQGAFGLILIAALGVGGVIAPLYSLLIAYVNDYLEFEDMPAASGGLVFVYGAGAMTGPLIAGQVMELTGPAGFWLVLGLSFVSVVLFGIWRMLRRPDGPDEESAYVGTMPTGSYVAIETVSDLGHEEEEGAS
jgi:MFS family permease